MTLFKDEFHPQTRIQDNLKLPGGFQRHPFKTQDKCCCNWGYQVILNKGIEFDSDWSKFSFFCWILWSGLEDCLERDALRGLVSKNSDYIETNVLLTASLFGGLRRDTYRRMLPNARKPSLAKT